MIHRPLLALTAIFSLVSFASYATTTSSAHRVRFHKRAPSKYPAPNVTPPQSSLPQDWIDALNAAVAAGKIPDIPTSKASDNGVAYPSRDVGNSKDTCSWTVSKCNGPDDIVDAPDGEWTIAFDDGPTQASSQLYQFLQQNNQAGTHFMIGSQILALPKVFQEAISTNQEVALHTWSHSLLTTKSNMEVLAELGWNMQIIYDMSGRVPKLYRPPQGDLDARVRAIASEIFGLKAAMWNYDTNDWCLHEDGSSECPGENPGQDKGSVKRYIRQALHGSKSPGVSILEHELNTVTVGLFTDYYPSLASLGWKPQAVSDHYGLDWYTNAKGNSDTPTNVTSFVVSNSTSPSSSASSASPTLGPPLGLAQANTNTTSTNSTSTTSSTPATSISTSHSGAPTFTNLSSVSTSISGSPGLIIPSLILVVSMGIAGLLIVS